MYDLPLYNETSNDSFFSPRKKSRSYQEIVILAVKLDGVAPLITNPSATSFTTLSDMCHATGDM